MGSSGEYGDLKSPHVEHYDGKPKTIYNKAKKLASNYLLQQHKYNSLPITILRLYLAYGPYQDINRFIPIVINNCIKNNSFELSHCKQLRDFIYIDDVVEAIIKSLSIKNLNGEIINIGTGKPIKLKNIITKIFFIKTDTITL